jgi:hypothetical protein
MSRLIIYWTPYTEIECHNDRVRVSKNVWLVANMYVLSHLEWGQWVSWDKLQDENLGQARHPARLTMQSRAQGKEEFRRTSYSARSWMFWEYGEWRRVCGEQGRCEVQKWKMSDLWKKNPERRRNETWI